MHTVNVVSQCSDGTKQSQGWVCLLRGQRLQAHHLVSKWSSGKLGHIAGPGPQDYLGIRRSKLQARIVVRKCVQLPNPLNGGQSKQEQSFLGMELDSVSQTAHLTQELAQLNCLNTFKNRTAAPLKQFQRLLGHMAAAAAVTPLGLLHMRPLQHWLHGGRGRAARCGSKSLQPAAKPSPRGQTFHSFGQECPWNRSPGTLWFTQMPLPKAGGPRSMGMQCRGFGRVPSCTGTSTA